MASEGVAISAMLDGVGTFEVLVNRLVFVLS
jgi:hypothetical protein